MTDKPIHPEKDELVAFGLGKLEPDNATKIETHLGECEACCETLLDLKDDTFVELVRSSPEPKQRTEDADGNMSSGNHDPAEEGAADDAPTAETMLVESGGSRGPTNLPAQLEDHPRYRIVELIGKGGMGDVYKAEHRLMDRPVALKLINRDLVKNNQAVERFRREVRAAARLSHPNIVTAHDAEQAGDAHFLVMEFVEGLDLASEVQNRGPLPIGEACDYIRQAAEGLQHAHDQGMVHRDIKPHNLMLSPDGQVRILDFGLASFATESALMEADATDANDGSPMSLHLTTIGSVMGTPDYIAPEQARDAHSADIRADIYSLGCTLRYLLTGEAPFTNDSVVEKLKAHEQQEPPALSGLREDVPAALAEIVARMMAKNPDERFQTPAEVVTAFAPFADAQALTQSTANRKKTNKLVAVAAGLLSLVLAAIIFVVTDQGRLEIHSPVDGVQVTVTQANGKVRVLEPGSGTTVHWLPSGEYRITPKGDAQVKLDTKQVTVTRFGRTVLTMTLRPAAGVTDHDRLQGIWNAESISRGGVALPNKLNPMARTEFDGNQLTVVNAAGSTSEGTFDLDSSRKPKQLRLQVKGQNAELRCIYKLEGDRLTLCMNQDPRGSMPSDFSSASGSRIDLIVLRRAPQAGEPSMPTTGNEISEVGRFQGSHLKPISSVAVSSNGRYLLSGSYDYTVRLYDIATGNEIRAFLGHTESLRSVAFSHDDEFAVSGGGNGVLRMWKVESGDLVKELAGHTGWIRPAAFSPNGEFIVSGSADYGPGYGTDRRDNTLRLWETKTGREVRRFEGITQAVNGAVFTPDGRFLVAAGEYMKVGLWNVETGKLVRQFAEPTSHPISVAIGLNGQIVATGHVAKAPAGEGTYFDPENSVICLWDINTGQLIRKLYGHTAPVNAVAFSPHGKYLISGSGGHHHGNTYSKAEDNTLRLWNVGTGKELCRVDTGRSINGVAFLPDGRSVVSGGGEFGVEGRKVDLRLWRLPEGLQLPASSSDEQTGVSDHDRPQGPKRTTGILTNPPTVPPGGLPIGKNLIADSSLEDTQAGELPMGWSAWLNDGPDFKCEVVEGGVGGKHCLQISGAGTRGVVFATSIPMDRTKRYSLKGRVKVEGEAGTWAVIKLNYFNKSGWLGVDDRIGVTSNDVDWKYFEKTDRSDAFPEATLIVPTCHIEGNGTAWFDDIEVIAYDRDKLPDDFDRKHGKNNRMYSLE